MDNTVVVESITRNAKITEYKKALKDLRKDGVDAIIELKEEINSVKKDRILTKAEKEEKIAKLQEQIEKAKVVAQANKAQTKVLEAEAVNYVKTASKALEEKASAEAKEDIAKAKEVHANNVTRIKAKYIEALEDVAKKYEGKTDEVSVKEKKVELRDAKIAYNAAMHEENSHYSSKVQNAKDEANDRYQDRRAIVRELRNGKETFIEKQEASWKNWVYQFNAPKFLLNNALYITIIAVFIACLIIAPISGKGNLLTLGNIFEILEQSSTRMFYALGVAGLILLAGTDLSVGRMVALGSVTTSLFLHKGTNIVQFFGLPGWNFDAIPMAIRVIIALLASVALCTLFSAIAGYFTAKFKMHPFITTLSTQLVIYGFLYLATTGVATGGVESGIRDIIGGRISMGENLAFPKIIIYAVIAIVVMWFIWNKTKFGKNMYAVGGNAEAAAVSGISVFWTTLGVFIMAGVMYGCGSFLEAFRANASASSGSGWELDAIAACVVGGISFNGGIGKIKGAVAGVIIFTALTYLLSALGVDTNLQFVFKGIIIMAACALDSVKYLKKK